MVISSIFGVIVLYETDLEDSQTFKTIQRSLSLQSESLEVLLYDNSFNPRYNSEYFEKGNIKINYIHDSSNSGIGKAYNKGAVFAKRLNKKWLLLLDQDTEFPNTIFDAYLKGIKESPSIKLIAPILHLTNGSIFSPCRYIFNRGFFKKKVKPGLNSLKYSSPVNSGMLVDVETFEKVGGYNEKIKLDFSDFQFIEKFKRVQRHFLLLNEICIQDFSNDVSDIDNLEKRFIIYCNDAKNCDSYHLSDPLFYGLNSFLRAVKLCFRTRSAIFLKRWFKIFIF